MSKWRRAAYWSIAGFAVLVLLCALALHALLDKEWLKQLAHDKAQAAWSRELTIGDLSLQLRPFPALHAQNVTLSNPSWAQHRNFLEAESVHARLELLPLLSGRVIIKGVSLDGLAAHLEMSADGGNNWDLRTAAKPVNGKVTFDPQLLTRLRVKNAQISYRDKAAAERTWHVETFHANGKTGWRDVRVEAHVSRDGHPLQFQGTFGDLSGIGADGAVTDGIIDAQSGPARLHIEGKLPLAASLQHHAFNAHFEASSLTELFGFLGIGSPPLAPISASATLRDAEGKINATDLKLSLGKLNVTGDAKIDMSGAKPSFDARLQADRLDWAQTLLDAGRPPPPPKPAGELFRTHALPWNVLAAMDGVTGNLDMHILSLRLRTGLELKDAKASVALNGDQLNVGSFSARMLGGTAAGSLTLDASRKAALLNLKLDNTSLAQWFAEVGKNAPITGGPMNVNASVSASGSSMKELAASITGPVTIRLGPATIISKKASQAETLLTGLFSAKSSDRVQLACAAANLPFKGGRAAAKPIAGARSEASQLLTSGFVDLRRQTLDLRGRVRARSGVTLGVSTLADEVKLVGKISKPDVSMDEGGALAALARIGAAILTGGVSIVGTALWDAANPASDPCQVVFSAGGK